MSSHRVRKRQAAYSKLSKKPGLVSTLGRSNFVRKVIRRRSNCSNGCKFEILGVLVAVIVNNSPIEIPLTFTEPITVDWDDENNRGKVTYQPGDRVFHNYLKANGVDDADPRERTITVTYKSSVEFDYSEDQGSYLQTHAAEIEADDKYTFAPKVGDNLTGKDGTQYYVSKIGTDPTELELSTSSFPIKKVVDAAFEFNADSNIKQGDGTVGLSSGDKIFDTAGGADAIEFIAGTPADLWVYTTRNDKKDGILDDAGTVAINPGKKFFLSTNDPYAAAVGNSLVAPFDVFKDNEVVAGSGFFSREDENAGNDFTVYKKTPITAGSGAEGVLTALGGPVNAEGNAIHAVEEFRHDGSAKTEGQIAGTAAGVNDGDVVVGDLIVTAAGARYFAATTAAQGAKFKIYTDDIIPRADTAGIVGPAAGFGIERAVAVMQLSAAELETAEERIHQTKWANIIADVTDEKGDASGKNTKDNLTFNRAGAGTAGDEFQFFRDLVHHEKVVGNDGQVYYALNPVGGNMPEGTDLQLLKDANDTRPAGANLDPAGVGTAVAVAAGAGGGQRDDVLKLFEEGAIEQTNGAGTNNAGNTHLIYKRSKVNTIRKSIKEIKKFGKEKMTRIRSFEGASNLKKLGGPNPPSFNPNLKDAFKGAANLEIVDNIKKWNTHSVTNMDGMFKDAAKFNLDVKFDTKNVTNMKDMFKGAKKFNKAVDFNTEKVTNMKSMFEGAVDFNQPIAFNTKKVENVTSMFDGATAFDQNLDDLDFRKVTAAADIRKGTTAIGGKNPPPALGQRKARLSGNVVALETGDKLFVRMINGDSALGYVDNVFKSNFDDTTDKVYKGFTPGNNTFVSIKTGAGGADKKTKATLTVNGVTATILGIEVRHDDAGADAQELIHDSKLFVYLSKDLGPLGMKLTHEAAGITVVLAKVAKVGKANANLAYNAVGADMENYIARDGFKIGANEFVKPAGLTVYRFEPAAGDEKDFDDVMGTDWTGGGVAYAAGERSIVFTN